MDQTCGNCRFFLLQDRNAGAGICRRYPPTVIAGQWVTGKPTLTMGPGPVPELVNQVSNIAGQNPPTTRDLWCGEWQEAYGRGGEAREAN